MTALIEAFEHAHPTIDIRYTEFNTSELHAAVLAASPDEAPDIVISSAMDLQVELVNRGLALPITVSNETPEWARWRNELFGFTSEPVALVFNRAAFADRCEESTGGAAVGEKEEPTNNMGNQPCRAGPTYKNIVISP